MLLAFEPLMDLRRLVIRSVVHDQADLGPPGSIGRAGPGTQ